MITIHIPSLPQCLNPTPCSAHWCGPCRQFTPRLAEFYRSSSQLRDKFEIVFVSADHDSSSFAQYYSEHPWLAVDYESDEREAILANYRVNGIPKLTVLSAKNGEVLCENAVQELGAASMQKWIANAS